MTRKNKKKHNIIFYTLFMILMFIIVADFITGVGTVYLAEYFNKIVNYNKYGLQMYLEIAVSLVILVVLFLSGNFYIFKCKKEKLLSALKKGWPLYIIMIFIMLPTFVLSILENGIKIDNLITLTILCIAIGVYEEMLCRAWLQNEFIERFGSNKKGVIISILISSFIFGFMHITNLSYQSTYETIMQIINAFAMGVLLGSIYYKSQNIFSVIILHAIWDFTILFADHTLLMDCAYIGTPSLNYIIISSIPTLLLSAYYIIGSILIMREKNTFDKDKLIFEENRKLDTSMLITMIVLLVFTFLSSLIPTDTTNYQLECYNFEEMHLEEYELHRIIKNEYNIEYETHSYKFFLNNKKAYIQNMITREIQELPFNNVEIISMIQNNEKYILIVNTNDYKVYYSDYIINDNMRNGKNYLEKISNSFEEKYFPNSSFYGYININNDNYNYPCLITYYNEMYIIDKNGKETLVIKD